MTTSLRSWLMQERGRSKALADHLGLTFGRISQMADVGVPTRYMFDVRDFTNGEVSIESMIAARSGPRTTHKPAPELSNRRPKPSTHRADSPAGSHPAVHGAAIHMDAED